MINTSRRGFPLSVAWRPAETTVGSEFDSMLAQLESGLPAEPNATHLAGLVTRARSEKRRR